MEGVALVHLWSRFLIQLGRTSRGGRKLQIQGQDYILLACQERTRRKNEARVTADGEL